jgi:hypothetical protein
MKHSPSPVGTLSLALYIVESRTKLHRTHDSMHSIRSWHDFLLFFIVFPALIALYFHSQLWYPTDFLKNRFCCFCTSAFFTVRFAYRHSANFVRYLFSSSCNLTILDILDHAYTEVRQVLPPQGTREVRARIFEPGLTPEECYTRRLVWNGSTEEEQRASRHIRVVSL